MDEVEQRHEQEFEKVCDEKFLGSDVSTDSRPPEERMER